MKGPKCRMLMRVVTIATLITAFVLILLVGYWVLWPYKILTDYSSNVSVSTNTLRPGDPVIIKIHACKHYDLPELISRELVDGFVYTLPSVQMFYPVGCHEMNIWVPIPFNTPPGVYRISMTSEFKPNPLRSVYYPWHTNQFEVLPRLRRPPLVDR